jgi:hypothetical protein
MPKTAHISQALRAALAAGKADEFARFSVPRRVGERREMLFSFAAIREIADGGPHQTLQLDAKLSDSNAERLTAARKRREEQAPRGRVLALG